MEKNELLNLNDFLNLSTYMNKSLQVEMKVFDLMCLILVCFEVVVKKMVRCFQSRINIPFIFFISALFAKIIWVMGFLTKITVCPKIRASLLIRISCLCKHDFRICFISFSGRLFSFITSSASTSLTSVWNCMEGSITVDVRFTRPLRAK